MSDWFLTHGLADVSDELLVGAVPLDGSDVSLIARLGVRHVVNLVQDEEYPRGSRATVSTALAQAGIDEERIGTEDFGNLSPEFLERAVSAVNAQLDDHVRTYLHCRAGMQRSASVAAGVIALRDGVDIDEALRRVSERRPSADPLPHQREDLERWWRARTSVSPPGG